MHTGNPSSSSNTPVIAGIAVGLFVVVAVAVVLKKRGCAGIGGKKKKIYRFVEGNILSIPHE